MIKINIFYDINSCYIHSRLALTRLERTIKTRPDDINELQDFLGMTENEARQYFQKLQDELETAYVFKIVSAMEAVFRQDFNKRVRKRKLSQEPNKSFKKIFKKKATLSRVHLKEDILEIWKKKVHGVHKPTISKFYELINYRHWIAHGQYWLYQQKKFDIPSTITIVTSVFNECRRVAPDFSH